MTTTAPSPGGRPGKALAAGGRSPVAAALLSRFGIGVLLMVFVASLSLNRALRAVGRWPPRTRGAWSAAAWWRGGGARGRRAAAARKPLAATAAADYDEDAGKLCVRMPALGDFRVFMVALPKEAYTVSGAMSRAGLDDGTMTEITGRGLSRTEEYVENLKALWSFTEGLSLRSGDIDLSTVRLRNMGFTALRDSRPPAVLGTPLLRRALAATPALLEPLQRSLDRYVYTSYKWPTEMEQLVVSAFMTSPYVSIVDGANMSAADFGPADAVFIPFPLTNMKMRPSVLHKLKRILARHTPALDSAPAKHVFVWGRIMQDAVKTLDYYETMRSWIKRYPIRHANMLTFEPYRVADGLTRQHAVPYPGIVRYDQLSYLPDDERAVLSTAAPWDVAHAGNTDVDAVVDAYRQPPAEGGGGGAGGAAGAAPNSNPAARAYAPPRFDCDPVSSGLAWKAGPGRNATLLGAPLASPKPWPPPGQAVFAPPGPGRGPGDPTASCTDADAMGALRAFRPFFATFIGNAIGESGDRTAVLKQLYHCAECAVFDAGHFASNTQHNHFGVVWTHRLSVFCVQPTSKTTRHGESPSRKGFFDALLLGCIPVVVDRRDPAAGATAPVLPFAWAIPWREIAVMLPRAVMNGRLLEALRAIPPAEIRLRQAKLAEAARLVQWDWRIMEFKTLVRKAFGRLGASNSSAARAARAQPGCARDAADMLIATLYQRSGKAGGKTPGVHVPRTDASSLAFVEPV
jgi:hypothetical protein